MTSTNEKSRLAGNQATLETLPDGQNSTTANGARLREVDPVVGWLICIDGADKIILKQLQQLNALLMSLLASVTSTQPKCVVVTTSHQQIFRSQLLWAPSMTRVNMQQLLSLR